MLNRYKSPLLLALALHVVRNLMAALLDQQALLGTGPSPTAAPGEPALASPLLLYSIR